MTFKKETEPPEFMDIKDELVLNGKTWEAADDIEKIQLMNFKPSIVTYLGIMLLDEQVMYISYRNNIHVMHYILNL